MAEYSESSGYAEYEYLGTANGTSFAKRHPYLLWQIIGWSILLADAVFVVIAALQDFGEWCYPVIVLPFIAALFAVIGSPFLIYFSRKAKIPQAASKREESVVRSRITMISQIRGKSHPVLMALLIIALALGLLVLTLQLGMRGYILPRFLAMVAMVVVPFVGYAQYFAAQRKRFMAVPDAAYLVDVHYADQSRYGSVELRGTDALVMPVPAKPSTAMLDFVYNWLREYLATDWLTVTVLSFDDLLRSGVVVLNDSGTEDTDPTASFLLIPARQFNLGGDARAQLDEESKAIGAFWLSRWRGYTQM